MNDPIASPASRTENRKRQILIVEDEFINREILKANLEQDYEILSAGTGTEAMDAVRSNSETLSLILLDLNLPDFSGMDVLRRMKADPDMSRIPVIVLTSEREAEVESLNSGASDFIPKPYPMHEVILARVRRTIELSENRDLIRGTERDQLTGLYNRDYFARYAERYDIFHKAESTDAVVLDVSHFRMINERYGRSSADRMLRRIRFMKSGFCREASFLLQPGQKCSALTAGTTREFRIWHPRFLPAPELPTD